jgi:hypothetical protein
LGDSDRGPGWLGANLPAWRKNNSFTKIFLGGRPLTGYHLSMVLTLIALLHLPVFFAEWSWQLEARVVGFFITFLTLEDWLWFVINPAWGLRNFKKSERLWWHPSWFLGLPTYYWITFPLGILVILWGFGIIG